MRCEPTGTGSCFAFRAAAAALSLLFVLQVPVALAQTPVSWSRVKHGRALGTFVDPALDAASVRVALRTGRMLSPSVPSPEYVVRVELETGPGMAVAGRSGARTWTVHVMDAAGRPIGTTVFDYEAGVIRDPEGRRVAWRAESGDLKRDLEERWRVTGTLSGFRQFVSSVCNEILTRPYGSACLELFDTDFKAGVLCLAILLALTILCNTMDHVVMSPDGDSGGGEWGR